MPSGFQNGFSPREFAKRNGIGVTKTYQEINAGRLIARKCGSRTIITLDEERAWVARLPKLTKGRLTAKTDIVGSGNEPENGSSAWPQKRHRDGVEELYRMLRGAK